VTADADVIPEPPEGYYDEWTSSPWHRDDVDELLDGDDGDEVTR
jgi:hypothetical protein